MKPMSAAGFRLYSLGTERPASLRGDIREVWESEVGDQAAVLAVDGQGSTTFLHLARDVAGRFSPVGELRIFASLDAARAAAALALAGPRPVPKEVAFQGLDLFTRVVPQAALHPYFRRLEVIPHSQPARRVLAELGPWIHSADPHFVREFQTQGFDQRLWEIYLWASFREAGFDVEQLEHPDFLLKARGQPRFSAEATTAAASQEGVLADHPDPQTVEEMTAFLRDYMPMKFGGPLTAKLNKRFDGQGYWGLPHAAGLPFVIAIADFHVAASRLEPGSMVYSQSALPIYLYGTDYSAEHDAKGELQIGYRKRLAHTFKSKKIESGFFDLPEAENVSAILFSNAGTISKFTRIGVLAGFSSPEFTYVRTGFMVDPDPNATHGRPFGVNIGDPGYQEGWGDELQVFHNPRARLAFDPELLPGATHHHWEDGMIVSYFEELSVLTSLTHNIRATDNPSADAEALRRLLEE